MPRVETDEEFSVWTLPDGTRYFPRFYKFVGEGYDAGLKFVVIDAPALVDAIAESILEAARHCAEQAFTLPRGYEYVDPIGRKWTRYTLEAEAEKQYQCARSPERQICIAEEVPRRPA